MSEPQPIIRPALRIPASGEVRLDLAFSWSLSALQQVVGGYIEILHLRRATVAQLEREWNMKFGGTPMLVINEEGKLYDLPTNIFATIIAQRDRIVGDALIVNMDDPPEEDEEEPPDP